MRNYLEGDRDLSCCLSFPSGYLAGQKGLSSNPNDLQEIIALSGPAQALCVGVDFPSSNI